MRASRRTAWRVDVRRLGVPGVVVAAAIVTLSATGGGTAVVTQLAQLSPQLFALDVITGVSIIVAGATAWWSGRGAPGLAAMLAGLSWFGADWAGATAAPGVLRGAGLIGAAVTLPLVLLALVTTRVRGIPTSAPTLIRRSTLALVAAPVVWLVLWVPSLDLRCLAICDANPLGAGVDFRLARLAADVWQGLTVALAALVAATAAAVLVRSAASRRWWPIFGGGLVVGVAWAAWGVSLLLPATLVSPTGPVAVAAYVARAFAILAVAAGVLWWTMRTRRVVAAIERMGDRLAPFPESASLAAGLATALADPGLRLVYPLPGTGFVDVEGRVVDPATVDDANAGATEIRRSGELVAVVLRSAAAADDSVPTDLGPAVLLAADNERLLASMRHEVAELRSSRARIVETGDIERRRIERDLHDGAQQRMLGIVHDLATAATEARRLDDPRAPVMDGVTAVADETIDVLRKLARGIRPAMLEEAGLAAALETLADEAPIPVVIQAVPEVRYPSAVEGAVWRVIARVVVAASRGGASAVRVTVDEADGRLLATIGVEDFAGVIDAVSLGDVVGAAGGDLRVMSVVTGSLRIVASVPCG